MVRMEMALYVLAGVLWLTGLVGCVVPAVPGPPVAYAGFLCLLWTPRSPGWKTAVAVGIAVAAVTVLDFAASAWGAKKFKCSRWGAWGGVLGAFVGVFFFPLGLLAGPFAGAVAGELLAGRSVTDGVHSGIGAVVGFLGGMFAKLLACAAMPAVAFWAWRG